MTVTPAPWYITVAPSEVDPHEEERPTGLIVHHAHDHADHCENKLKRGVILAVGSLVNRDDTGFNLEVGDVVYYHRGVTLRGDEYVYPSYDNLIAYEKGDA